MSEDQRSVSKSPRRSASPSTTGSTSPTTALRSLRLSSPSHDRKSRGPAALHFEFSALPQEGEVSRAPARAPTYVFHEQQQQQQQQLPAPSSSALPPPPTRPSSWLQPSSSSRSLQPSSSVRPLNLHNACAKGDLETVRQLVKTADINEENADGKTPLVIACENYRVEIVRMLLDHHADVSKPDVNGYTPLMLACQMMDWNTDDSAVFDSHEVVSLLIKSGANVNAVAHNGLTALCIACSFFDLTNARLLLRAGARIPPRSINPLSFGGFDLLLQELPEVVHYIQPSGDTSLHLAQDDNHVRQLIAAGCKVNLKNANGDTSLHIVYKRFPEWAKVPAVQALLAAGADPNILNNEGKRPSEYDKSHSASTARHAVGSEALRRMLGLEHADQRRLLVRRTETTQRERYDALRRMQTDQITRAQQAAQRQKDQRKASIEKRRLSAERAVEKARLELAEAERIKRELSRQEEELDDELYYGEKTDEEDI